MVDFDDAITTPHYAFDLLHKRKIKELKRNDLEMFQDLIDESGVKTSLRVLPNFDYRLKLFCAEICSTLGRKIRAMVISPSNSL